MRLIWNAGAAVAVTAILTGLAFVGAVPGHSARASTAPASPDAAEATPHRHYTGLPEHFDAANTTHDGKLTADQARQAGWSRVVRHFDEIDTAHAGFVTEAQIHSFNVAHHHARKPRGET